MTGYLAVLAPLLAGLYQPLGTESGVLIVAEDGRAWLTIQARIAVRSEGTTIVWDLSGAGTDAATARLSVSANAPLVRVSWRRQAGELVQWRLDGGQNTVTPAQVSLSALVKDLKVEREHVLLARDDTVDWQCAVKLSGWKGKTVEAMGVRLPDGEAVVSLKPDQTASAPVWQDSAAPCHWALRWDSRGGGQAATRTLVLDRTGLGGLGRRSLPAGRITLTSEGKEWQRAFGGAAPGEPVEIDAGPAETVRVERTKAAATQVNVRSDVHRRLAAFDEQVEYEYAVMHAGREDVTLEIVEHPAKGWRVEDASHQWRRKDAETMIITVPLAARSKASVRIVVIRPNQVPQ